MDDSVRVLLTSQMHKRYSNMSYCNNLHILNSHDVSMTIYTCTCFRSTDITMKSHHHHLCLNGHFAGHRGLAGSYFFLYLCQNRTFREVSHVLRTGCPSYHLTDSVKALQETLRHSGRHTHVQNLCTHHQIHRVFEHIMKLPFLSCEHESVCTTGEHS